MVIEYDSVFGYVNIIIFQLSFWVKIISEYSFAVDDLNNSELATNDGLCRIYDKEIVVRATDYMQGLTEQSRQYRTDHVVRHELVHAVAQECGVPYGDNEDLVDWIAHIIPIVNKAFNDIKDMAYENKTINQ